MFLNLELQEAAEAKAHAAYMHSLYWIATGDGRTGANFTYRLEDNSAAIYDCGEPDYQFTPGDIGRDVLFVFRDNIDRILNVVLMPKDGVGNPFRPPRNSHTVTVGLEGTEPINEEHLIKTLLQKGPSQ